MSKSAGEGTLSSKGPYALCEARSFQSGGNSFRTAHWLNPAYDPPHVATLPLHHGCRASHSTMSCPSRASLTNGSNSPAELPRRVSKKRGEPRQSLPHWQALFLWLATAGLPLTFLGTMVLP